MLADALDSLAGVVCTPYHTTDGSTPDERDAQIARAVTVLDRLVGLLRTSPVSDDEGFFALGAVAVGVRRSLVALQAEERQPSAA